MAPIPDAVSAGYWKIPEMVISPLPMSMINFVCEWLMSRNLPFAPSNVIASWNAASGTMMFQTTDNSSLDVVKWNAILQQVIYIPVSGVSGSKKIILSVGDKPFVENNQFHFYEFVRRSENIHDFATAEQQATQQDQSYCVLQPYLMTITSEAEKDFVKAKMVSQFGDWQNGWIGASRNQNLEWRWHGGADNQKLFWVGDGAGAPVSASGTDIGQAVFARLLIAYDLDQSSLINYSWNRTIMSERDKKVEFNYFTAGSMTEGGCNTPAPYNCQPVRTVGHDKLAILDAAKASGFWFAMRENVHNCVDGEINSICGHYREWGGSSNDPAIKLGGIFPIDVAAHRQVCRAN